MQDTNGWKSWWFDGLTGDYHSTSWYEGLYVYGDYQPLAVEINPTALDLQQLFNIIKPTLFQISFAKFFKLARRLGLFYRNLE